MATAQQAFTNNQGLASGKLLILTEKPEEFEALHKILHDQYLPVTGHEKMLVLDMAKYKWLADRAVRLQGESLEHSFPYIPASLTVLLRLQASNERLYQKAIAQFLTNRKEKPAPKNGFVSQKPRKVVCHWEPSEPGTAGPWPARETTTPDIPGYNASTSPPAPNS
jgi:hypothetical protein